MEQRILIITPDDEIKKIPYTDYKDLQKAVDGYFERCASFGLPVISVLAEGKKKLPVDVFCNEEFMLQRHKFSKVNAVATLIAKQEIRGNVAIVVREMETDSRGFYYKEEEMDNGEIEEALCECWTAEDTLLRFIKANEATIQALHKKIDIIEGNKRIRQ